MLFRFPILCARNLASSSALPRRVHDAIIKIAIVIVVVVAANNVPMADRMSKGYIVPAALACFYTQ